jgi:hypothetical protein
MIEAAWFAVRIVRLWNGNPRLRSGCNEVLFLDLVEGPRSTGLRIENPKAPTFITFYFLF